VKQWWSVMVAVGLLSACSSTSLEDQLARQVLEQVRTGQLDAVTSQANPALLQSPAFVDDLFRQSSQFPGYPPEDVTLVQQQDTTVDGQPGVVLTYHYDYIDETVPAEVTLIQANGHDWVQAVVLGTPEPVSKMGHFLHRWGLGVGLLVVLGVLGGGIGWKARHVRQRRIEAQQQRERRERRQRRRARRAQRQQAQADSAASLPPEE
jgi:hypothetical protein